MDLSGSSIRIAKITKFTKTAKVTITDSPAHPRITRNLFKGLEGRPIQSYENRENYKIYEIAKFTIICQPIHEYHSAFVIFPETCLDSNKKLTCARYASALMIVCIDQTLSQNETLHFVIFFAVILISYV